MKWMIIFPEPSAGSGGCGGGGGRGGGGGSGPGPPAAGGGGGIRLTLGESGRQFSQFWTWAMGSFWKRIRILKYEFLKALDPDQDLVVNRTLWPQIVWRTFEKREYGNWSKISYRFSKLHPLFSWSIRQLRCQKNKYRASTSLIDFNPQDGIQILEFCSRLQIRIQHPATEICEIVLEKGSFFVFYPMLRIWILTILPDFQTISELQPTQFYS